MPINATYSGSSPETPLTALVPPCERYPAVASLLATEENPAVLVPLLHQVSELNIPDCDRLVLVGSHLRSPSLEVRREAYDHFIQSAAWTHAVLPLLASGAVHERNPDLRSELYWRLNELPGGRELREVLAHQAASKEGQCVNLSRIDPARFSALDFQCTVAAAAGDPSGTVRYAAARVLYELVSNANLDQRISVAVAAAGALRHLDPANQGTVGTLLLSLEKIGTVVRPPIPDLIMPLLRAPDALMRARAAGALVVINQEHSEKAAAVIVNALRNPAPTTELPELRTRGRIAQNSLELLAYIQNRMGKGGIESATYLPEFERYLEREYGMRQDEVDKLVEASSHAMLERACGLHDFYRDYIISIAANRFDRFRPEDRELIADAVFELIADARERASFRECAIALVPDFTNGELMLMPRLTLFMFRETTATLLRIKAMRTITELGRRCEAVRPAVYPVLEHLMEHDRSPRLRQVAVDCVMSLRRAA